MNEIMNEIMEQYVRVAARVIHAYRCDLCAELTARVGAA